MQTYDQMGHSNVLPPYTTIRDFSLLWSLYKTACVFTLDKDRLVKGETDQTEKYQTGSTDRQIWSKP